MSIESKEDHLKGNSVAWCAGILFCLPYAALWAFTIYLNLKLLPRLPNHPPSPVFNLVLNFLQLIPPALVAFVFGFRLAMQSYSTRIFRKLVPLTFSFAGYEILLVMTALVMSAIMKTLPSNFPTALWLAIPLIMFPALSILFGLFHTISAVVFKVLFPKLTEA